jgi:hypothetical protein
MTLLRIGFIVQNLDLGKDHASLANTQTNSKIVDKEEICVQFINVQKGAIHLLKRQNNI